METKVESCVREAFVVECQSISLIDLQLKLDRHLNQHLTWYLVHTTLTLDWHINWHLINHWLTVGQHLEQCWPYVSVNIQWCVSKNCLTVYWLSMKCWWSINMDADIPVDVNWDCESSIDWHTTTDALPVMMTLYAVYYHILSDLSDIFLTVGSRRRGVFFSISILLHWAGDT